MPDATIVEWIRDKFTPLVSDLDERGRRRWAATEAMSLGRGGIAVVAEATGISDRTIRNGIQELKGASSLQSSVNGDPVAEGSRERRSSLILSRPLNRLLNRPSAVTPSRRFDGRARV